jgi:hypothetical protein
MTLIDAPAYDEHRENRNRNLVVLAVASLVLLVVLFFAGRLTGHGWLFTDLPAEHKVSNFFKAMEAKDYAKAYGIYYNDADWQQHPQKYSGYDLKAFTNDWTTDPRNFYPITSYHIDTSATDGSGFWGTGVIVAVRVNGNHKLFMFVDKKDGTITWPAPHELLYN